MRQKTGCPGGDGKRHSQRQALAGFPIGVNKFRRKRSGTECEATAVEKRTAATGDHVQRLSDAHAFVVMDIAGKKEHSAPGERKVAHLEQLFAWFVRLAVRKRRIGRHEKDPSRLCFGASLREEE